MDLITILTIIIISLGLFIGKIIQKLTKDETQHTKKIIKTLQDLIFALILFSLFMIFNLGWIISAILALAYFVYAVLNKKQHKTFNLIILSATIASLFRTKYFLTIGSIGFIYTLLIGLKTKKWKEVIKKAALVLILTIILIYLRII